MIVEPRWGDIIDIPTWQFGETQGTWFIFQSMWFLALQLDPSQLAALISSTTSWQELIRSNLIVTDQPNLCSISTSGA